ncbi:MAG: hypothetical protein U0894_15385 [Pirellulales bacterium]
MSPRLLLPCRGITGGYLPLAALLKSFVWNAFLGPYSASRTFFHGHTYGGNPLGAAAARQLLEVFEEEDALKT